MNDIKSVLGLLSKGLNLCTHVNFTIEHLRLAKHNEATADSIQCFWEVLNVLSDRAVKRTYSNVDFQHFDLMKAVKLNFACLEYTNVDFYALSKDCVDTRILLIALAWLIASHNVFKSMINSKIIESYLSQEFPTPSESLGNNEVCNEVSTSIAVQTDALINKTNKLSNNLKEINELMSEKALLVGKLHRASVNTCGLSHLSALELMLIKKSISIDNNDKYFTVKDEEIREELQKSALLIDIYNKWTKCEHVFFNWMETVVEGMKKDSVDFTEQNLDELSTFICIIRHLTKKKIHELKSNITTPINIDKLTNSCSSRFFHTQTQQCEATVWQKKMEGQLSALEIDVKTKINNLNAELKLLLKSITNCLQV